MQIFGVIVGIVPQLRKLLVGASAPLCFVQTSAIMLGWESSTTYKYDP